MRRLDFGRWNNFVRAMSLSWSFARHDGNRESDAVAVSTPSENKYT